MTDLYSRVLLWHKLLAMQTGGLALCSARHRLNRDEARGWSTAARNVSDDIEQFLKDGTFVLDDRGVRVVDCAVAERSLEVQDVDTQPKSQLEPSFGKISGAVRRKSGGLRIAKRKTK